MVIGRRGGSLLVGVEVSVTVGLGVSVRVGGGGVGDAAAAVWVRMDAAICATEVATVSTCGVAALGWHAAPININIDASPDMERRNKRLFML